MKKYLIILIIASGLTHFVFFGHPKETVFDEVHFGKFISGYFTHEYFFDIHPPLGKLLISGMGYMAGFEPGFSFAEIGQNFPDRSYLWLRLLPMLAGTLLPLVIFLLVLELGLSRLAAFAAGMLVAIENALIVQSRIMLLDAFLLLFGFLALLFYLKSNGGKTTTNLLTAGVFAGLAASVKWTGLTFLAIIGILYLINWFESSRKFGGLIRDTVFLLVLPFIIYFSVFAIHFSLLNKSGPGDAFMTPEFRKTLAGSADNANAGIHPLNIFEKFKELNVQMYKSNATLTATHPYSSKWYTWPFMIRPIYYWNSSAPSTDSTGSLQAGSGQASSPQSQSRIYFLGNPVIWWGSTVAMMYLLLSVFVSLCKRIRPKLVPGLLIGAYLLNMLPFIGISRAMFLYHYMIGLVFAVIALVYLLDKTENKNKKRAFIALLVGRVTAFIFFAPLTYGLPLSDASYNIRVWSKTWL